MSWQTGTWSTVSRTMRMMAVLLAMMAASLGTPAQERISDKDLEKLVSNLASDTERLEKDFVKAVEASAVRRTSREKELKQLAKQLTQRAKGIERNFKKSKTLSSELELFNDAASKLKGSMEEYSLAGMVTRRFETVRTEFATIAGQFGFEPTI